MIIRNSRSDDIKRMYELWNTNLGDKWAIEYEHFEKIIRDNDNGASHFITEIDGEIVGFVATGISGLNKAKPKGSIILIMVREQEQGKGIGKKLLSVGEEYLKSIGVYQIQLGAGANSYFWPGVPENLPDAISFFSRCGWTFTEQSVDLVGDLSIFNPSPHVHLDRNILIKEPSEKDMESLLTFEQEQFPNWYHFFYSKQRDFENILVAKDEADAIVGSVLLFGPFPGSLDNNYKWKSMLSDYMGGFGALGVKKDMRGRGIGMALALKATEILKSRGVVSSYLGWTWLIDWYGKIGYKEWRSYQMSWKNFM